MFNRTLKRLNIACLCSIELRLLQHGQLVA